MAEEKEDRFDIRHVTTFVAVLPGLPLEEVMKKFSGQRTPRTLAAARRIAAKKREIKIPANLLKKLHRLVGGFDFSKIKNERQKFKAESYAANNKMYKIVIGDLEVVIRPNDYVYALLYYRGINCAYLGYSGWQDQEPWRDKGVVRGAAKSLGKEEEIK